MIRKTLHETEMANLDKIKNIKIQHKNEIDKIKNKYIEQIEIFKTERNKEEMERAEQRQKEIKDAYSKIDKIKKQNITNTCDKCNKEDEPSIKINEHIKTVPQKITYTCKGCIFKTNWMENLKEYKMKCNYTKQRKK